jgi:hypothetical protein
VKDNIFSPIENGFVSIGSGMKFLAEKFTNAISPTNLKGFLLKESRL